MVRILKDIDLNLKSIVVFQGIKMQWNFSPRLDKTQVLDLEQKVEKMQEKIAVYLGWSSGVIQQIKDWFYSYRCLLHDVGHDIQRGGNPTSIRKQDTDTGEMLFTVGLKVIVWVWQCTL